jgi:hypothetical protein
MDIGSKVIIQEEVVVLNITSSEVTLQANNRIRHITREHFNQISTDRIVVVADVLYEDYYDLYENIHVLTGELVAKFQAKNYQNH